MATGRYTSYVELKSEMQQNKQASSLCHQHDANSFERKRKKEKNVTMRGEPAAEVDAVEVELRISSHYLSPSGIQDGSRWADKR